MFIDFNRESDKMIFQCLQKEFDAARASQTQGSLINELIKSSGSYSVQIKVMERRNNLKADADMAISLIAAI